jgi:hypothetical protein
MKKIKNDLTEAISLSGKVNTLLTEHYDNCWRIKNKGYSDYFSLNEDLIKKIEEVFNYYKSLKKEEYRIRREKYGK